MARRGAIPTPCCGRRAPGSKAMASSLEKYVCIETVDRSYYRRVVPREAPARPQPEPPCGQTSGTSSAVPGPRQLESTDRVRLEVAVSQGSELHSWPGATRFDSRDVDELIRDGPVSTGAFSSYLASVFAQPGVTFQYLGEQSANGKTVFCIWIPRAARSQPFRDQSGRGVAANGL